MANRKGLLRDWKTLARLHSQQKITLPKQKWLERPDCFLQRKEEKNALKSKKKWFRWHFSLSQKAKIRGEKGRMKGGKRGFS